MLCVGNFPVQWKWGKSSCKKKAEVNEKEDSLSYFLGPYELIDLVVTFFLTPSLLAIFSTSLSSSIKPENIKHSIEFLDLRTNKNAEKTAEELVKRDILTPFNLVKGPLVRFKLLRIEDEKVLILFNMHHIISDGWSMEIFTREFLSFYNCLDYFL